MALSKEQKLIRSIFRGDGVSDVLPRHVRSYGSGSIDEAWRKGIRYWRVRISATNTLGASKRIEKYAKTEADAKKLLQTLKSNPNAISTNKLTVGTQCERYLKDVKSEMSPATWNNYASEIRVHILPHLAKAKFCTLTTENVRKFFEMLKETGVPAPTRQAVHKVLHRIYELALADDTISKSLLRNPVRYVKKPSGTSKPKYILTHEEAQRLLDAAAKTKWYPLVYLLFVSGLRIGEASGLKVEALHLDGKQPYLDIYQGIADDEKQRPALGKLKTFRSLRHVWLDEKSVPPLSPDPISATESTT